MSVLQFESLLTGSVIAAMGIYTVYLRSYFRKKAENDATKEDIEELTRVVEATKSEFSVSIEKVKSNLTLITNQTLSLATEKRNAIYNCNDAYYKWYNVTIDLARTGYGKNEMKAFIENLITAKMAFSIASTRLEIFYYDEDFLILLKRIALKTQNLSDLNAECFLACHNAGHEVDMLAAQGFADDRIFQSLPETQSRLIDEYSEKQSVVYKQLETDLRMLRETFNKYITQILQ